MSPLLNSRKRRISGSPGQNGIPVSLLQPRSRSYTVDSDLSDKYLTQEKLIHPEGGFVYNRGSLVSDDTIPPSLQSIGNEILSQCAKSGFIDITVFLRRQGSALEYYVAVHSHETIAWIHNHRPDGLLSLNESRLENTLIEEYWAHMEAMPGPRHVSAESVTRLKNILSSLAIDSATSDGSTSPFSYEQIQDFLQLLSSFNENNIDEYQAYSVARIWNMIWHARVINNYASSHACLDRFTALANSPPAFSAFKKLLAIAMLGAAERNLARCSRAWAGRVAYVGEWREFKAKNETEWQQVVKLASAMMIASLLLLDDYKSKLSTLPSTLLSLSAAAYGHHLVTESQNLGDHAADASSYFQKWEKPDYNVQCISLRNATPQALLGWAFITFVGAITGII